MFDQAARFAGDAIPAYYDSGLEPFLAAPRARDCGRNRHRERLLRDALPRSARLVASDLNLSMLKIARQKFDVAGNVEFEPADAAALPFADRTFDAIVCQFGVMFFPDKDKALARPFACSRPADAIISTSGTPSTSTPSRASHTTPSWADCVAKLLSRDGSQIFQAVGATIE